LPDLNGQVLAETASLFWVNVGRVQATLACPNQSPQ
jgi:hypothetical protein